MEALIKKVGFKDKENLYSYLVHPVLMAASAKNQALYFMLTDDDSFLYDPYYYCEDILTTHHFLEKNRADLSCIFSIEFVDHLLLFNKEMLDYHVGLFDDPSDPKDYFFVLFKPIREIGRNTALKIGFDYKKEESMYMEWLLSDEESRATWHKKKAVFESLESQGIV